MAMTKSRKKGEFARQKSMAAQAIRWMQEMHVDFSGTRAVDVVAAGGIDAWAEKFYPKG